MSSHNDLFKPDNILFDGARVWLVDWEAAFLNDRYADLAAVANLVVSGAAEERVFLETYFGRAPTEVERARLFLMQQLAHVFYTMAFLLLGAAARATHDPGRVDFADFRRRLWAGELNLAEAPAKLVCGRAHWTRLVHNLGDPRFDEAIRMAKQRDVSRTSG